MTRFSVLGALFVLAMPVVALAQPTDPAQPTPDETKIRDIVDREVARILNERAQKEAADRAAREAATPAAAATAEKDPEVAGSSGPFDVRLAFTLSNENLLVKPGETIPSVPGWRFGSPNTLGVLFFDNYDTRYSGFETLNHLVMYRKYHKGHFDAEGALVIRLNALSERNIEMSDAGTYIRLENWKDPSHKDPTRLSLTVFPVSSDRMRLGYSYRLSWGGSPEYRRSKYAVPGAKVQYDGKNFYAFAGAKTSVILDRATAEEKAAVGLLAGAGIDPNEMLRLEVNGGYFDRGYNELVDVNDQKVQLYGVSAQAAIHKGMPVGSSIDYKLYRNNNERVSGLFDPVKYPGGLAWLAMAEFTMLGQTLKDPAKTGSTKIQYGRAGDVNVRVMLDRIRLRADLSFRDLAFILHSVPSLPTYSDFPSVFKVSPNLFAAVGADKNWNDFLTLGFVVGVEKPATLTSPQGTPVVPGQPPTMGESTAVFRNNGTDTLITILPPDKKAVPQVAVKGTSKIDFARFFSAVLEVFYSYDGNATRYRRAGPEDPFEYEFGEFNQIGINATLQARF